MQDPGLIREILTHKKAKQKKPHPKKGEESKTGTCIQGNLHRVGLRILHSEVKSDLFRNTDLTCISFKHHVSCPPLCATLYTLAHLGKKPNPNQIIPSFFTTAPR